MQCIFPVQLHRSFGFLPFCFLFQSLCERNVQLAVKLSRITVAPSKFLYSEICWVGPKVHSDFSIGCKCFVFSLLFLPEIILFNDLVAPLPFPSLECVLVESWHHPVRW